MGYASAVDAMVRWLVLTLAGVAFFAIYPASAGGSGLWAGLGISHAVTATLMVVATVLHCFRVCRMGPWKADALALSVSIAALIATIVAVGTLLTSSSIALIMATAAAVGLQMLAALRIDHVHAAAQAGAPEAALRR